MGIFISVMSKNSWNGHDISRRVAVPLPPRAVGYFVIEKDIGPFVDGKTPGDWLAERFIVAFIMPKPGERTVAQCILRAQADPYFKVRSPEIVELSGAGCFSTAYPHLDGESGYSYVIFRKHVSKVGMTVTVQKEPLTEGAKPEDVVDLSQLPTVEFIVERPHALAAAYQREVWDAVYAGEDLVEQDLTILLNQTLPLDEALAQMDARREAELRALKGVNAKFMAEPEKPKGRSNKQKEPSAEPNVPGAKPPSPHGPG